MQADNLNQDLSVNLTISQVNKEYLVIDSQLELSQQMAAMLVHQSYIFFVIQLRTGIAPQDLPKITSYFLNLCDQIITQELRGISFIINGQHHVITEFTMPNIKELFTKTFIISNEDDYSTTLIKTRHAVQSVSQKLKQTKITLLFFFSHLIIDHKLGVKKRSYIDHLNQHSELCRDQVTHLSRTIKKFTDQCRTYIISYDKEGYEDEDYSLCDTDLMNQIYVQIGRPGDTIRRNYSYGQIGQALEEASALMLFKLYSLDLMLPIVQNNRALHEQKEKKDKQGGYQLISFQCQTYKEIKGEPIYVRKVDLDEVRLKQQGLKVLRNITFSEDELDRKMDTVSIKTNICYSELTNHRKLISQAKVNCIEINKICWDISKKIISNHRVYKGGRSHLNMEFDKDAFLDSRDRLEYLYDCSKEMFQEIRESGYKGKEQFQLYEAYNQFKRKIDSTREILVGILKKLIGGSEIGKLSQVISLNSIKNSLKNKLLRKINANPFLLDQVYDRVKKIVDYGGMDYPQMEVDTKEIRSALGNCIVSDLNLVKALCGYDCLGVAFEVERPMAAIADPGRLRIRQISPFLMSTSTFFQKFLYRINYTPDIVEKIFQKRIVYGKTPKGKQMKTQTMQLTDLKVLTYRQEISKIQSIDQWNQNVSNNDFNPKEATKEEKMYRQVKEVDFLRDVGQLERHNYQERCDYTNRAENTPTVLGFMPLFLEERHWKVAKLLMKPCLAFTATGQPLGYMFSQFQTIPFMLLSFIIKACKELEYEFAGQLQAAQKCKNEQQLYILQSALNRKKWKVQRLLSMKSAVEITCRSIMLELSGQNYDQPLLKLTKQRFIAYKDPINRTVDVIPNNSAFIGQLFIAFKHGLVERPSEAQFDWFLVRLLEEQLRRETDGWNEEETQDAFIDKLLNLDVEAIKRSQSRVIVQTTQDYTDIFLQAMQGQRMKQQLVQIQKDELEMMLKKGGKFNQNQRMLLIQYKRLYENRVLWMWYVRFLLYGEIERRVIHKWKALGLTNSYMLFSLIIQNKKQRKNYKRREAVIGGHYADPFDYKRAREYLENQFSDLYNKVLNGMCKEVQFKKAKGAAEVFALTTSLEEAAGVWINGHNLQPQIFTALWHNEVPLFAEKMAMLVHGVYRGVRLRKWSPSRKRINVLRRFHKVEFMRFQYKF